MSLIISDNTNTARNLLEVQDLAAAKFACVGGFIEPIVSSNNTIDGTGSSTNPLVVNPSADAGNQITLGTDGRLFVAADNPYTFDITDGVTTETVNDADTVTFADGNDITVTVTAPDTVTITNVRPARVTACSLAYFTGV
jgi:hypothetical protein